MIHNYSIYEHLKQDKTIKENKIKKMNFRLAKIRCFINHENN